MTYHRTIHLSDTDAAGVVYFSSLLSICHEAYERELQLMGIDLKSLFLNSEIAIPIIHAEIDFYQPLFCGYNLRLDISITNYNNTGFSITYYVISELIPNKYSAIAQTTHVSIDINNRQKTSLAPSILNWLHKKSENMHK